VQKSPAATPANLDQHLTILNTALCHTQELIALAYQLSCELHPAADPSAVVRTSGRLATLMYVATQQLAGAQAEASALSHCAQVLSHRPATLNRRDH
jgi:hypothetical protein